MKQLLHDYFKERLRSGRLFKKLFKETLVRSNFSRAELQEYQLELLKKTLAIAYNNVPFYNGLFKQLKLTPDDFRSLKDLQKLPIMDKDVLRNNFKDFKNKNFKGPVFKGYSSGSSGTPATFLRDLYSINYFKASYWRQYTWAGKTPGSRRVTLRGDEVCPVNRTKPPFWRYNRFSHELIMSSRHYSDENLKHYVDAINEFNPFDLYAYPAGAYWLADYCCRMDTTLPFSAVFTDAEVLSPQNREVIEGAFNCKVHDQYGSAERVVNLAQCEHRTYHEMTDYSYVEYIPVGNNEYEVVGTTLFNTVMPLIRYNMKDIVEPGEADNCPCGRNNFRNIKKIIGRKDDSIILKDGRRFKAISGIFLGHKFLKEAQIIQKSLDEFEILLVPYYKITSKEHNALLKQVHKFIGNDINCTITEVKRIERDKSGKYKRIKNLIDRDDLKWH